MCSDESDPDYKTPKLRIKRRFAPEHVESPHPNHSQALPGIGSPGTIFLRLTFHVSQSAGMRPLPMNGSRMSASTPLS